MANNKSDGVFGTIRRILYSSRVGCTIRWALVGVALVVMISMLVNSFYIGRDSYRVVSKSMLSSTSDVIKDVVVGRMNEIVKSAEVLGGAFVSVRDEHSPVRADRNAFIAMLQSSVAGFDNCYAVGM